MFGIGARYVRYRMIETFIEWYRREQIINSLIIIIAMSLTHYLGFNYALDGLPFPFWNARFYFDLTLTFFLYIIFIIIALRVVYALFSALWLGAISIAPKRSLAIRGKLHEVIPYGFGLLVSILAAMVFLFTLLINYTSMGFFSISFALLVIPIVFALWIVALIRAALLFQAQLITEATEEQITANIEAVRDWITRVLAGLNAATETDENALIARQANIVQGKIIQLQDYVASKDELSDDVINLVNSIRANIQRLQWYRHVFSITYPFERRIIFVLPLIYAFWIGYSHAEQYFDRHVQDIHFTNGEIETLVPIQHGTVVSVFYDEERGIVQIPAHNIKRIESGN